MWDMRIDVWVCVWWWWWRAGMGCGGWVWEKGWTVHGQNPLVRIVGVGVVGVAFCAPSCACSHRGQLAQCKARRDYLRLYPTMESETAVCR